LLHSQSYVFSVVTTLEAAAVDAHAPVCFTSFCPTCPGGGGEGAVLKNLASYSAALFWKYASTGDSVGPALEAYVQAGGALVMAHSESYDGDIAVRGFVYKVMTQGAFIDNDGPKFLDTSTANFSHPLLAGISSVPPFSGGRASLRRAVGPVDAPGSTVVARWGNDGGNPLIITKDVQVPPFCSRRVGELNC
jgi:hypothetical protein